MNALYSYMPFARFIILLLALSVFSSCGGGDDDDSSFVGAAIVSINTSPRKIDTGDRTQTRVTIQEVHENGILLKVRFPAALSYVLDSAILEVDGDEIDVGPAINSGDENDVYLVFFFSNDTFGEDARGTLTFELEASSGTKKGEIEVDADVDDPLVDNGSEFDTENPEFVAESTTSIEVID